jgi:hypothetical protein
MAPPISMEIKTFFFFYWIEQYLNITSYKKLESKNLNGLGWNRNASYFFSTWMELGWRLTNQKTESLSASICECK